MRLSRDPGEAVLIALLAMLNLAMACAVAGLVRAALTQGW